MANFEQVNWQEGEEVTSEKLNKMAENDVYLKERKPIGIIKNLNPFGQVRQPNYISDNNVVYADYVQVSPPGTDSFFDTRISFPTGFFDPEFLPIVVCTVATSAGINPLSYYITSLNHEGFNLIIHEHAGGGTFAPGQLYWASYIASGVKL